MKLADIAHAIGLPVSGDGNIEICAIRSLETAGEGDLSFVMDLRHQKAAERSCASALIVPENYPDSDRPSIRSTNPYLSFAHAQALLYKQPLPEQPGIHPSAVVDPSVEMGEGCHVGPHVVLEAGVKLGNNVCILANSTLYTGVKVGDGTLIHSNCVIREYCEIGRNVILQNGVVIGSDGFGFARDGEGNYIKILQAGRVLIDDEVEIQAHTCIDRGTLDDTRIGKGAKLDNLIQVAHGCEVGENTVIASQAGLAGSTKVGDGCMIGGQVGLAGHMIVGDGAVITAQSGVAGNVEKGSVISGSPAFDNKTWRRAVVAFTRLPAVLERLRALEKAVETMKEGR